MAHSYSYFQYQKGDQGDQGPRGYRGWQGYQGYQGFRGWQGYQGVQGHQGYQGTQGEPSSAFGIIELQGNTMGTGLIADQYHDTLYISGGAGITVVGSRENDLLAFKVSECQNFTIGTIGAITLNPGYSPTVDITVNQADEYPCNIVLDWSFGIPQGWQGDQGYVGATGPQGASIKGDQGYQGDVGADSTVPGPTGPQGSTGVSGNQGYQGLQGLSGNQGTQGPTGSAGPQGYQGLSGEKGDTGDTGLPGEDSTVPGPQGETGFQGPSGQQGDTGATGTIGDQGPQGEPGDKYAIVPDRYGQHVGLFCTEMPTAYFEDIIKIKITSPKTIHMVDRLFLDVIEIDTLEVTSAVPSDPAVVGAQVHGHSIQVNVSGSTPNYVTVKISGVRKGRRDKRFPVFTRDEAERNNNFWSQWNN